MKSLTIHDALFFDYLVLIVLIAARTVYSLVTGYMLPDEGWYYTTFVAQPIGFSVYRPIMNLAYTLFFTGTDTIREFFVRGAIYSTVWAIGTVYVLSRVLRILEIKERPAAFTLLTFIVLPIFPLMAVFFVTETMGLFFVFSGIYFSLRYLKDGKALSAAAAAAMFLFASEVREPYIVFVLATPFVLFAMRWRLKAFLGYGLIALIAAPLPVSIVPFNISQPFSTLLFYYIPNYFFHAGHVTFPAYVYVSGVTLPVSASLWSTIYAFLLGIGYGLGPVFAVLIIVSIYYTKSKLVLLFSSLAILSFFVTAELTVAFQANAASVWTSDIIRLSSTALPASLGLAYLYSRVPKIPIMAIGLTLLIGLVASGSFLSAIQSTQDIQGSTIDRLSLSYRAPYLMMYQDAQPDSLIVSGVSGIGSMTVFALFGDNITVEPIPANSTGFHLLVSQGWSHVYLYDDWVILNASFIARCNCYPAYYTSLILSGNLTTLWSNSESYGLEMP